MPDDLEERAREIARAVMPAITALESECTASVMDGIPDGHRCGPVVVTEDQWKRSTSAFEARDAFFAEMMPTERDAIQILHAAYERLKKLDWNDIVYCPKDGRTFDAIEAGSTGIHTTIYDGEWPDGHWWVLADDDQYPAWPILYRRTEEEKARWASLRLNPTRDEESKGG